MVRFKGRQRARRQVRPAAEGLESRSLLTAGAGNTFAIMSADIETPGAEVSIPFTIHPEQFTLPRGRMVVGIDIAPMRGASVEPLITQIIGPNGRPVPQVMRTAPNPFLPNAPGLMENNALLVPIQQVPGRADEPVTYEVRVTGANQTTGPLLVGFYLPGDANGDGLVDQTDMEFVRATFGAQLGDPFYRFDADVNRDGRIGPIDIAYTMQNLGVRTKIAPVVMANLDPASDTGLPDRITDQREVRFHGIASAGATITYSETHQRTPPVTTVVPPDGYYALTVSLADGSNIFQVSAVDSFGQVIEGQLAPVTYRDTVPMPISPLQEGEAPQPIVPPFPDLPAAQPPSLLPLPPSRAAVPQPLPGAPGPAGQPRPEPIARPTPPAEVPQGPRGPATPRPAGPQVPLA